VLQSHHFRSGEELDATLHRYVWLYNQQLPQSALGSKTPLQATKDWHTLKPELLKKQPYYRPGCDTQPDRDNVRSPERLATNRHPIRSMPKGIPVCNRPRCDHLVLVMKQ
jgi:hypothetical protein